MYDSGRTQEIKQLIKAGEYEAAQSRIDGILHVEPENAQAKELQQEIIWRMRQEDEKKPVIIQGPLAQFAVFAAGFWLCMYPFVSICTITYNTLFLHHYEDVKTGGGHFGLYPVVSISPISAILGAAGALCLGVWIMRVAYNSWKNN